MTVRSWDCERVSRQAEMVVTMTVELDVLQKKGIVLYLISHSKPQEFWGVMNGVNALLDVVRNFVSRHCEILLHDKCPNL